MALTAPETKVVLKEQRIALTSFARAFGRENTLGSNKLAMLLTLKNLLTSSFHADQARVP